MCAQVLIFDFDVHHGNGTNDVFFDDPSVLFISTHQAGLYPGTGALREVGTGDGEGTSINLPLPGDCTYKSLGPKNCTFNRERPFAREA